MDILSAKPTGLFRTCGGEAREYFVLLHGGVYRSVPAEGALLEVLQPLSCVEHIMSLIAIQSSGEVRGQEPLAVLV